MSIRLYTFTHYFTICLFLFLTSILSEVIAQPANDACTNAIPLIAGAPCVTGTNVGATVTAGEPTTASCWPDPNVGGTWYSFTAPSYETDPINNPGKAGIDLTVQVTTGGDWIELGLYDACGGSEIACIFPFNPGGIYSYPLLDTGKTYYVLLATPLTTTYQAGHCITYVNHPEKNGMTCNNAFTIYPGSDCVNYSSGGGPFGGGQYQSQYNCAPVATCEHNGTMAGDAEGLDGSCAGNDATQPAFWMKVYATTTTFDITNETDAYGGGGAGNSYDYAVYSGSCGSLSPHSCHTIDGRGASQTIGGLTPGNFYYILVTPPTNLTRSSNSTCITSSTPYSTPDDDCVTAPVLSSGITYQGSTINSTSDGAATFCNGTGSIEGNSWYRWCAEPTWTAGDTAFLIVWDQECNVYNLGNQISVFNAGEVCGAFSTTTSEVCNSINNIKDLYYYEWEADPNECFYIQMDGYAGVACNYSIQVNNDSIPNTMLYSSFIDIKGYGRFDGNLIQWDALNDESPFEYFEVEVSVDGKSYKSVGNVNGLLSKGQSHYEFFDENNYKSNFMYYRVRGIDINNKSIYSKTVIIKKETDRIQVYYDNNEGHFVLYSAQEKVIKFKMIDLSGQELFVQESNIAEGVNFISINKSVISSGMYLYLIYDENGQILKSSKVIF